jgi:hypothetical protein
MVRPSRSASGRTAMSYSLAEATHVISWWDRFEQLPGFVKIILGGYVGLLLVPPLVIMLLDTISFKMTDCDTAAPSAPDEERITI